MTMTVKANGAEIPVIGFGTWELRGATAVRCVQAALDAGYRHIDTAAMYANESEVGEAIRQPCDAARRDIHHHKGLADARPATGRSSARRKRA